MKDDGSYRLDYCEVVLSDWMMRAIEAEDILTISRDYFRIRRPLERRLYEIGRKHCGHQKQWQIDLAKLQAKTGSNAPLKRFRHNLRQIIGAGQTPDYRLELNDRDQVIYRPRRARRAVSDTLALPSWAEDKARDIALAKGWDYQALLAQWTGFAISGMSPRDAGAAFIGFCQGKPDLR